MRSFLQKVWNFLKENRWNTIVIVIVLLIGLLAGSYIQKESARHKLLTDLNNTVYASQQQLLDTWHAIADGRDFAPYSPKYTFSYLCRTKDAVGGTDRLSLQRPSMKYINQLNLYLLSTPMEDAEEFYLCTRPYLDSPFGEDMWDFFDALDAYLQTPEGLESLDALYGYSLNRR